MSGTSAAVTAARLGWHPAPHHATDDLLIAYRGRPRHGVRTVSYYQALEAETLLPRDIFRGKTVVVGRSLAAAPTTEGDIVEPAIATEKAVPFMPLTPLAEPTLRRLAGLKPTTIALMHGPTFKGDGAAALTALADYYGKRLAN